MAPGRALGALLITLGLVTTAACTPPPEAEPVASQVKLLQGVRVGFSAAAGVQTTEGTTVSVSASSGNSSAADTTYNAADVVGELPIRVSLQYRAVEYDAAGQDTRKRP